MKRNAAVVLGNVGTDRDVEVLLSALDDPEALVRAHAASALARIGDDAAVPRLRERLPGEADESVRAAIFSCECLVPQASWAFTIALARPRMYQLNSSFRSVLPELTLERAKPMASRLGVTRVTDTTRLDCVGIPVFASIRPGATDGSLCVNAGKGVRPIEACVGAMMEAIEFALAELGVTRHAIHTVDPRELLGGRQTLDVIGELCPVHGIGSAVDAPLDCVYADDLVTGASMLVPAELVFFPYQPRSGTPLFGSSTNGLASGNTVDEATLHALMELIERDAKSFMYVRNGGLRLVDDGLPEIARDLVARIRDAGLQVTLRVIQNEFAMPVCEACLFDPASLAPTPLANGFGCHIVPEIALVRAITEAAQTRLTAIHGGRDDLVRGRQRADARPAGELDRVAAEEFRTLEAWPTTDQFDAVRPPFAASTIDDALRRTIELLLDHGIEHVCRVVLTEPTDPVQVVKLVVPRLEFFQHELPRIGPRLLASMCADVA